LLVSVNTLVMNRSLYPKLPFDPVKDLVPVSLTSWGQLVLVANPRTGFRTPSDLIAAARKRPGAINYASPGVGTPHHLSMELFKATNHIFITHIPYRGTAPAVTELVGGQVDVAFLPIHVALPFIKAGRLEALAIGSSKRHPLLPQVPTIEEAHAGKVNVDMWYGIFAPPGTPQDFVRKVNQELHDILATPDVRTAFETQGMDPATSTPDEFRRLVEQDADRWSRVIRSQGITAE
jgi:tripartite-type tricarboxylate transporter receptor subunit TctC